MAVSLGRVFYKASSRKLLTPFISLTGGYRRCYSKYDYDPMDFAPEQFTPKALEDIENAKEIAVEYRQLYIKPECMVLGLLDQEEGIAKQVLLKANCDVELLAKKMIYILEKQPKTTDLGYWHKLKNYVSGNVKNEPECRLDPFISATYRQMIVMGDELMGEDHLIIAHHLYVPSGKTGLLLKSAARAVRADLKKT